MTRTNYTMRKSLLLSLIALAACSSAPSDETENTPSVMSFKDAKPIGSSGGNLIDHGGKILPASNTYAIWWGTQSSFPVDAKSGLDALFDGLSGSSYLGIAGQYMRGAAISSSFHTNWTDTTSPPTHSPSVSLIAGEACKVINQNNATPDPNGIYFVYTSNFPHVSFCGWHAHSSCNGVDIQVSYIPNLTGVAGCNPSDLYGCNLYSEGTRALANVSAHEFAEAITDADINAWLDNAGSEIGDKCAWLFSGCVNLSTGSFQLQELWSNSISGCQQ